MFRYLNIQKTQSTISTEANSVEWRLRNPQRHDYKSLFEKNIHMLV